MIAQCNCAHPAQDAMHGVGYRVHNVLKDGGTRCTVCSKTKSVKKDEKKEK